MEEEEEVYVAVKQEFKQCKVTLTWAIKHNPRAKKFSLVTVYEPAQKISILGGSFLISQLEKPQADAHRQIEREDIEKKLKDYMTICRVQKVAAKMLLVEGKDVATALIQLIERNDVRKFVMGAAADKHYSKKMTAPKSQTARKVLKEALPSCSMWFICKGNLICTRDDCFSDGGGLRSQLASPSTSSTTSRLSVSDFNSQPSQRSQVSVSDLTSQPSQRSDRTRNFSGSVESISLSHRQSESMGRSSTAESDVATPDLWLKRGGSLTDSQDSFQEGSFDSDPFLLRGNDETATSSGVNTSSRGKKKSVAIEMLSMTEEDILRVDDVYDKLHEALIEIQKIKNVAHEESLKHRMVEKELLEAQRRARMIENNYAKEMKARTENESRLVREEELTEAQILINSLRRDCDLLLRERNELQRERDNAVRQAQELRQTVEDINCKFSLFSYLELQQATQNFKDSLKIGECGYANVYKGSIKGNVVTIKMLESNTSLSEEFFCQEAEALGKLSHRNLTTLVGTCKEKKAIVYEFFSEETLEDYLDSKDKLASLSWKDRVRIIAEICSGLVFLHSNKPDSVIHGDLRPANILLDTNFVSKLTDYGIGRLMQSGATDCYRWADPRVTFGYIDPEFFSTGELIASSDTYSFGIITLRLISGFAVLGIVNKLHEAMENGKLQAVLGPPARDMDFAQAQHLVQLALKCCEVNRKNRPDLVNDVWSILKTMEN